MSAGVALSADAAKVLGVLPLIGAAIDKLRAQLDELAAAAERVEQASALLQSGRDGTVHDVPAAAAPAEAAPAPEAARTSDIWSAERVALLQRLRGDEGLPYPEILAALNELPGRPLSLNAVKLRATRSGINPPALAAGPDRVSEPEARHGWTIEKKARLRAMFAAGASAAAVSRELGFTQETIKRVAAQMRTALTPAETPQAAPPAPTVPELVRGKSTLEQLLAPIDKPVVREEAAPPPKAIVADRDQIRSFVQSKAWPFDVDNLDQINAKCLSLGLPRFILGQRVTRDVARNWGRQEKLDLDAPLFVINAERQKRGAPLFIVPGEPIATKDPT